MRAVTVATLAVVLTSPVMAQDSEALIERYVEVLHMDEVFEILKEEGIAAGIEIAEEDEGITASPAWTARLSRIYDPEKMAETFRAAMAEVDDLDASEDALAFFEDDLGSRIVRIEIDARRAMMDDAVEEAMREEVATLEEVNADRLALYRAFIEANDLIESNVMGALNSNLAFYRGLSSNEQFGQAMDEGFMLSTVWQQEPEIRADMEDWTMNFSALAYAPLTEAEIESYIDISESDAGQKLNTALFAGFDAVFESQSFELGRAMAEFMVGEDT